ncbi:c-type cytochrome [Polluticoccus soli]|uniref:c-type cytochrome n=1 Tax=Polluticoccus soli TaxID=3034150 RepID=UPI0023E18CFD|nr:cytochrome c [Flavipsychrobacter sp. JY13-12]
MIRWIWLSLFVCFSGYTLLVYRECDNTQTRADSAALAGMQTWQDKNCQSCHQLYGLGGYMGPDLTNVASETGKGAEYMTSFIKHGSGRMPNFNLSNAEVANVIAFLQWVDKSGQSKVNPSAVHWTGTYSIPQK